MSLDNKKSLKKIKSSLLERSLSLTKMTLGAGGKILSHNIESLFRDQDSKQERWNKLITNQALSLSTELGKLKGSLMKAGQMISMYGELFLPPEANEFLKTLQSQSPPLVFDEIEKILRQEYQDLRDQLNIDHKPVGAASLGQVHVAHDKLDGKKITIALKVQYPGIKNAIHSDLKSLRSFLSLLKLLPNDFQTNVLFDEVEQMLIQELDYKQEAENTLIYRKLLGDDRRFVVPEVMPQWCRENVLATTFERGIAADDSLVKALSQTRRNQLAKSFLDLYFMELFKWGVVQTDPHLGNYKVRLDEDGNDQLVLLDFGAVRKYEDSFIIPYRKMIRAALMQDTQALEQASLELKFLAAEDPPQLRKYFQEFCLLSVEPFLSPEICPSIYFDQDGNYDWKSSDLPRRLTQIGLKIIRGFPLRTPPREIVFLDRKTGGVFIFMAVLGAKFSASEVIKKYL